MDDNTLLNILQRVQRGELAPQQALREYRSSGFEDVEQSLRSSPADAGPIARIDHDRAARKGFPEVVYGEGKTPEQISAIMARLAARDPRSNLLVTRTSKAAFDAVKVELAGEFAPSLQWHERSRCISLRRDKTNRGVGTIAVVTAGTTDLPVADEAALTAELMGHHVARVTDVGVAGLHRLLPEIEGLRNATVLIVVAGMEGALPSVVGGLVSQPVIAVPTSVGYGASFGGLAALLGMLNTCASGVGVVNIDNGFGAGYLAALINQQRSGTTAEDSGQSERQRKGL